MKIRTITYSEPELKDTEPQLAAMLTDAIDLDEANEMRWLEQMLLEFPHTSHIGAWVRAIMRQRGWREAYNALADYAAH